MDYRSREQKKENRIERIPSLWEEGESSDDTDRCLDGGEDGDGEVSAEEGVGDEAAEEAEHEGGAHEVGDDVGGLGVAQVHGAREVRHQVHGDAQRGQPLVQLRHCSSTTDTGQESGTAHALFFILQYVQPRSSGSRERTSSIDACRPARSACNQQRT